MAAHLAPSASSELSAALAKSGLPDPADDEVRIQDVAGDGDSSEDDVQMESADSQDETEVELPLQRTATQLEKQAKVQAVRRRVGELQDVVRQLRGAVRALAEREFAEDADADAVQRFKAAVDDERKHARNYGEDLLQELLALDKLSGLVPEDRASRKAAISAIEALLDDVDAAKSLLGPLDRKVADLQDRLAARVQEAAPSAAAAPPVGEPAAPSRPAEPAPKAARRAPQSARVPAAAQRHAVAAEEGDVRPATTREARLEPGLPGDALWARMELPLRLRAHEEQDRYVITLPAPGLRADEVDLRVDDDEALLAIRVLRVPQPDEAARMQRRAAAHLQSLASASAAHHAQVVRNMDDLAARAYASLGEGAFGLFETSVRIPRDADVEAMESTCSNGVLRVLLPKRLRRSAMPAGHHGAGNLYDQGAGWHGYPRWPHARPAEHHGFPPMFRRFPF